MLQSDVVDKDVHRERLQDDGILHRLRTNSSFLVLVILAPVTLLVLRSLRRPRARQKRHVAVEQRARISPSLYHAADVEEPEPGRGVA